MTTKHTPRPWRIGDAGNTIFGPKTDRPSPRTIATIQRHTSFDEGLAELEASEDKANAHLIAAAPELLRTLEQIAVASTEFADLCVPMTPECAGLISKWAKTAIAKATAS